MIQKQKLIIWLFEVDIKILRCETTPVEAVKVKDAARDLIRQLLGEESSPVTCRSRSCGRSQKPEMRFLYRNSYCMYQLAMKSIDGNKTHRA